jgi:S-DNA-T family DNA segregation ATPase FtsK/SpoIIIE
MARPQSKTQVKSQPKKKPSSFIEAKALFLIAFNVLLLLALLSFEQREPKENLIGSVGYTLTWILFYLFGWASYFIPVYFIYRGYQVLTQKESSVFSKQIFSFCLILISTCFLFTLAAEFFSYYLPYVHKKIYSEAIVAARRVLSTRYYLGGAPAYYLYKDLPIFNLNHLLGSTGVFLLFSFTTLIGLLLLTNLQFFSLAKRKILSFFSFCKSTFFFMKKTEEKIQNLFSKPAPLPSSDLLTKTEKENDLIPLTKKSFKEKFPLPSILLSKDSSAIKENTVKEKKMEPTISFSKIAKVSNYNSPSASLLTSPPDVDQPSLKKELKKQADILEETLKNFGIEAKVGEINCGPTITSFEVQPSIGVKVQKIKTLENDIALNLQAKSIRIIAPIPGKAAVGVEIPSLHPQEVSFKEMLLFYQQSKKKCSIPILLGKAVNGDHVVSDLTKMPHLLIAGATGSGKSVCINTIVMSILMNASPEEVRLMMVDPKKVELTQYSKLPHMVAPVITESHGAYAALHWLVKEMNNRYDILKHLGLRNITAFNSRKIDKTLEASFISPIPEKLPLIVMIIDEFADLMMVSSSDLETPIARIAQMARAVGIHVILATQRPSREVITGIIKANFACRIAFKVASRVNSLIILDETGAESLLGNGDLLFLPPGSSHIVRAQGAYIRDEDINRVIENLCKTPPSYLIPSFDAMKVEEAHPESAQGQDELYQQAMNIVLESQNASTTFLQRKLKIGYARAASLMDELEANKIIGPQEGSRARRILSGKGFQDFSTDDV